MLQRLLLIVALGMMVAAPALAGRVYNQFRQPGFRFPSELGLGGNVPLVTAGPIFDGLSAEEFASRVRVPGGFPRTRFVPAEDPNDTRGVRLVFAFGRASPASLCNVPPVGGGANGVVSVSHCIGELEVTRATLARGSNLDRDLSQLMHQLFSLRDRRRNRL
ncbi:MAG: hypothetical protein AAGE18_13455 [Pseudomonadota bacterium]